MDEDVIALIRHRLSRARRTLEDAKILFEKGRANSSVNRVYYAMFYSVLALLRTRNLMVSKHSGVRALFHREFVKTGIVPMEMGKFYDRMFINRQESDYEDFKEFREEEVEIFLEKAEEFIGYINNLVVKHINQDEK